MKAGQSLSLQFHREKDESWLVQSGRAKLELGEVGQTRPAGRGVGPGAAFHYEPGTVHRVTAVEDTTILEVSTPHLDDVVRLEDAYGRAGHLGRLSRTFTQIRGKVPRACRSCADRRRRRRARPGWSARMLRYLEEHGLVVPQRRQPATGVYGLAELNRCARCASLRRALRARARRARLRRRLRREPDLRAAVDACLAAGEDAGSWVEWEQRKHERLLAA